MSQDLSHKECLDEDVFKIVSTRQWCRLNTYVLKNKDLVSIYRGVCSHTCNSSHTTLQYACNYHPPQSAIKWIYNADPKAIRRRDCKGSFTLHIACAQGCSPSVIKYLLEKYPQAAEKTDKKDRTPFLLACKSYIRKSMNTSLIANNELLEVLHMLSVAAPMSFIREDCYRKAPLDYALEANVDMSVIQYVQIISSSLRQEMQNQKKTLDNDMSKLSLKGSDGVKQQVFLSQLGSKTKKEPRKFQAQAA